MYNMYKKNTLGNIIKEIRTEHQLSQRQLSDILGYKKNVGSRISELETGTNIYKNSNFISGNLINNLIDKFNLEQNDRINLWKSYYLNRIASFGYSIEINLLGKYLDENIAQEYINEDLIPNEVLYEQLILKYNIPLKDMEDLYDRGLELYKLQKSNIANKCKREQYIPTTDMEKNSIKASKEIYLESGCVNYTAFYMKTGIRVDKNVYYNPKTGTKPCIVNLDRLFKAINMFNLSEKKYLDILSIDSFFTCKKAYDVIKNFNIDFLLNNEFSYYFIRRVHSDKSNDEEIINYKDCIKLTNFNKRIKNKYKYKDEIQEQIEKDDYGYEEIDRDDNGEIEEIHNTMEYKFTKTEEKVHDTVQTINFKEKEEDQLAGKSTEEIMQSVNRITRVNILSLNIEGIPLEKVELLKSFINNIDKLSDKDTNIIKTVLDI